MNSKQQNKQNNNAVCKIDSVQTDPSSLYSPSATDIYLFTFIGGLPFRSIYPADSVGEMIHSKFS